MNTNRRVLYSCLWTFASLNYLYGDVVGLMDANLLVQFQTGVVNGIEISHTFLALAAVYMQIPIANVFLPHVIGGDQKLRWVQMVSAGIATTGQGASLFVGSPESYYIVFSVVEMAATGYIFFNALRWRPSGL